jgi:FAD/FMN-containing dehydrogenase
MHRLKTFLYDNNTGTAMAQLGLTLGQTLYRLDQQSRGGATLPVGLCSGIGIGGYLLGGGMGPLDVHAGLLCDRLLAVEMVTAQGDLVRADANRRPELLWAACGGGGQALGLVVSATLQVFPTERIANSVCVRVHFDMELAVRVFAAWQAFEQHSSHLRFEVGGNQTYIVGCFWDTVLEGFDFANATGIPGGKVAFQEQFDRFLDAHKFLGPHGSWGIHRALDSDRAALEEPQWYFARTQDRRTVKTMLTGEIPLPSTRLETVLKLCGQGPADGWNACTFIPIGESVRKRHPKDSAFFWRMARHSVEFTVGDAEPSSRRLWAQQVYDSLLPHKLGTYVNYPDVDLQEHAKEYWGENYARLQLLKAKYDPDVLFDAPQAISPAYLAERSLWT